MTKQEVKDEVRQYGRLGRGQGARCAAARCRPRAQRMMAAVPQADVVVTNPTHFAVALRYDGAAPGARGRRQGPGSDRRCRSGGSPRSTASRSICDPPLARALHSSTEIGQVIPEELYAAVARVLAFVYRAAGRRKLAL